MRDFDDVERMTRAFRAWARTALIVGLPVWLVLLLTVPRLGLGPMPSLALASLVAAVLVVVAERLRRGGLRRRGATGGAPGPGPAAPRRPMSAVTAVLLTLGIVIAVAYTLFVIIIVIRG
ncbi:MAG: hypothetical protein RIB67_09395 [Miltoncostaeaceae bacterium]